MDLRIIDALGKYAMEKTEIPPEHQREVLNRLRTIKYKLKA